MTDMNVEEALRIAREKAAMLRLVADGLASAISVPEPAAMQGLGEVCAEIEELIARAKGALDSTALNTELKAATQ